MGLRLKDHRGRWIVLFFYMYLFSYHECKVSSILETQEEL